jgi:hypothetical protein
LIVGCEVAVPARTFTERDSAGVRIVESMAGMWSEGEGWRVGAEPTLEIGVVEGSPAYQFSSIMSALRLGDRRILVAERTTGELRFFGPEGAFLAAVGRRGDGPGEFGNIATALPYRGDSILVCDSRARRITVLDRTGRLGRVQSVQSPDPPGGVRTQGTGSTIVVPVPGGSQGTFADGRLVHTATASVALDLGDFYRPEIAFMRLTAEGEPDRELGTFAGPGLGFGDGAPGPFEPGFDRVIDGERIYVVTGDGLQIEVRTSDGSRERLIRAHHRDLTVTQTHREAYLGKMRRAAAPETSAAELERTIAQIEFPATLPAFAELLVDAGGYLWAQGYPTPGVEGPNSWSIFNPEGRLLGEVKTPAGLDLHQIGQDFLLGVWRDELDVQYVRMYALERASGGE